MGRDGRKTQARGQVDPLRVFALDQIDLPLAVPALELLFPHNGTFHFAEQLIADEALDLVAAGEAGDDAVPMLPKPAEQVAGHANVERAVWLTRKDVDARVALLPHGPEDAARWMLKQVQHDGISEDYSLLRHPELVSGSMASGCTADGACK